jgi:hypothetical protein
MRENLKAFDYTRILLFWYKSPWLESAQLSLYQGAPRAFIERVTNLSTTKKTMK